MESDLKKKIEQQEQTIQLLLAMVSDLSRAVGTAEGKLKVSEMAGIVEGWMNRTHSAEFLLESVLKENREQAERIEELERDAEHVSSEFEGDCWTALRGILIHLKYDWSHGESVTAQEAYDWIVQELWERQTSAGRLVAELKDALRANERAWAHVVPAKVKDGYTINIITDARRQGQRLLSTDEATNG